MVDDKLFKGAIAGTLATVSMTAVLLAAERVGLIGEIPPKHITRDLLHSAGVRHMSRRKLNTATTGLHFTYGTVGGAIYGWLADRLRLPVPGIVQGIGFSLIVWAMSYMGWVPAVGIMRSAEKHGEGWVMSNIVSHIVYGSVLGALIGTRGTATKEARRRT